jgi:N-acetylglutamate synthase-like GNAT family acetyltransferase
MQIRNVQPADYNAVIRQVNDWWGGRQVADMLPKLFFVHFQDTSFVVEENGQIIAFVIGFVSQTYPDQAYIHFVGVHPDQRGRDLGRKLYERFFETVKGRGCKTAQSVTSPFNTTSIAFHTRMGFEMLPGDAVMYGVNTHMNYDGEGENRVVFRKYL